MKFTSALKAPLAAVCLIFLVSCANVEIRAQIDDLKSQLGKLQTDTATATAAAKTVAANASLTAEGAQNAVSRVQAATEANSKAIAAVDEKIDRMFKRPVSRPSITGE
jgi:methyl-accepting chemotaxis protein